MTQEAKSKTKIQYISCAQCQGSGRLSNGSVCQSCFGNGLMAYCQNRFYYWNLTLSRPIIKLRHLKTSLHLIVNSFAYAVGLAGIIALIYWLYQVSSDTLDFNVFAFWRLKSTFILIFWVSLIADMFVFYRISEEEAEKKKITKIKYGESIKDLSPNNWLEFKNSKSKHKIEVSSGFSLGALKILEQAFLLASLAKHSEVKPVHLFFCLLKDSSAAALFSRLNVDSEKLISKLQKVNYQL